MGRRGIVVALLGLGLVALAPMARAADGPLSIEAQPGAPVDPEELDEVFARARELELSVFEAKDPDPAWVIDRLSRAALLFERVGDLQGGRGPGYWRASRSTWLAGENLPLEDVAGRIARFEKSLSLANRGLAANPDCAECMLWKFISMGRLRTTEGLLDGLRQVKEMADLLDRGIALNPTYRDGDDNSTLGNLHYSSAIFYRVLPDWFWLRWMLGVRGDKKRALAHSRKALALHPNRLDYQIEVGTQLLCLGTDGGKDELIAEGRATMATAIQREVDSEDERREIQFAKLLMESPEMACGYTGDKVLEFDEKAARANSQ